MYIAIIKRIESEESDFSSRGSIVLAERFAQTTAGLVNMLLAGVPAAVRYS